MNHQEDLETRKWHLQKGRIFFGLLFTVALLFIFGYYLKQEQAEAMYENLRAEHKTGLFEAGLEATEFPPVYEEAGALAEESVEHASIPHLENEVDFAALQEQNKDVYAWIIIPGTRVDYPILQHGSDDAYYLNHTLEGAAGLPGSIYSERVHPKDFSAAHTVLYGHNMKNGTMFGSLHDYEEAAFFDGHPYVYIHLPERTYVYQIFAAVKFSDAYLPVYQNYGEEAGFNTYVDELRNSPGQINREIEVPYGSRLLTLSTCIGNDENHRFLVAAILAEEYEKEEY